MKPRRRENGFTLTEVLVVIAIIGLLLGIVLPGLSRARANARKGLNTDVQEPQDMKAKQIRLWIGEEKYSMYSARGEDNYCGLDQPAP